MFKVSFLLCVEIIIHETVFIFKHETNFHCTENVKHRAYKNTFKNETVEKVDHTLQSLIKQTKTMNSSLDFTKTEKFICKLKF